MRFFLAGTAFLMSCAAATAAPDDSRCPIMKVHQDAGVGLQQSDVSEQPTGTLVTCRYESNGGSRFSGQIDFLARCPNGKSLRFPGYSYSYPSQNQVVTGFASVPDSDGSERAVVSMWRNGQPDTIAITVAAHCQK